MSAPASLLSPQVFRQFGVHVLTARLGYIIVGNPAQHRGGAWTSVAYPPCMFEIALRQLTLLRSAIRLPPHGDAAAVINLGLYPSLDTFVRELFDEVAYNCVWPSAVRVVW